MATELAAILAEAETDWPDTVTISGTAYACFASATTRERALEAGGFALADELTVTMRTATLTAPATQSALTHSTGTYTVARVTKLPGGTAYRLHCVSDDRGA